MVVFIAISSLLASSLIHVLAKHAVQTEKARIFIRLWLLNWFLDAE